MVHGQNLPTSIRNGARDSHNSADKGKEGNTTHSSTHINVTYSVRQTNSLREHKLPQLTQHKIFD